MVCGIVDKCSTGNNSMRVYSTERFETLKNTFIASHWIENDFFFKKKKNEHLILVAWKENKV